MVRILHTADVHLAETADERRAALSALLSTAASEDVDVVTIGGDLFDSERAAEQCRHSLRELFTDRPYPVVTIPGNHDVDAFRRNLFFGDSFVPATETPFDHFVVGDDRARITTLPYTSRATAELLVALRDRDPFDGPELLLFHCSLEAPVAGGVGDEGEHRYFPVSSEQLAELQFDYYLAGHYHSRHRTELSTGGTFVYPGTPASVTRSETGPRTCVLVDTEAANDVRFLTLESFHYDSLECRVTPGQEESVLETVRSQVATWADRRVAPEITVDGYTAMNEAEFSAALEDASGDVPVENATRTVEHVLSHPLFEAFQDRLAERDQLQSVDAREDYDAERFQDDVWTATLDVFATLAAEGDLS